jgi:hypothetical protein
VPLVWAHFDRISEQDRILKHHARATHFRLVSKMDEADWCILPSVWHYYVKNKMVNRAIEFSKMAFDQNKYVLVWCAGDPEWIVPISNAIQIQEGMHKGLPRQVAYSFERPGFVTDYIQKLNDGKWQPQIKFKKPVVGFCGMASSKLLSKLHFFGRCLIDRAKYSFGRSKIIPMLHGYPINLRSKALSVLEKHPGINTNFIIRDRFSAGIQSQGQDRKMHHHTRKEFVDNILASIYTICVRGVGNFSKRFYETLACGRIPILISTDSKLPYEEFIDWSKHIVRVEHYELDKIAEEVIKFHSKFSNDELIALQAENRKLWIEMLSVKGYYSNLHKYLSITGRELPSR